MIKIFYYEFRRLILNKFFIALLFICGWYCYQNIENIACTNTNSAPFSEWNYCTYISFVLPVLLITLLFFISFLFSKQEKRVQVLINAAPIDKNKLQLIRSIAIIAAFILITAVPVGYSFWFYKVNFHFSNFGSFVFPTIIAVVPPALFIFGAGILAGRLNQGIIFALMILILLLSNITLPYAADLFGGNFYQNYPQSFNTADPSFKIPASVLIGKALYGLSGIVMIIMSGIMNNDQKNKLIYNS